MRYDVYAGSAAVASRWRPGSPCSLVWPDVSRVRCTLLHAFSTGVTHLLTATLLLTFDALLACWLMHDTGKPVSNGPVACWHSSRQGLVTLGFSHIGSTAPVALVLCCVSANQHFSCGVPCSARPSGTRLREPLSVPLGNADVLHTHTRQPSPSLSLVGQLRDSHQLVINSCVLGH